MNPISKNSPAAWLAVVALGWLGGCGGSPVPTFPVEGEMRLDGDPIGDRIAGASVLFEPNGPAEDGKVYSARGLVDKDGRYRLTTFSPGDGATTGTHRVAVVVPSGISGVYEGSNQTSSAGADSVCFDRYFGTGG